MIDLQNIKKSKFMKWNLYIVLILSLSFSQNQFEESIISNDSGPNFHIYSADINDE